MNGMSKVLRAYERWTEAREGDDRYQLIRKTVELGDEQGDIRRSSNALRPAVDLVEPSADFGRTLHRAHSSRI